MNSLNTFAAAALALVSFCMAACGDSSDGDTGGTTTGGTTTGGNQERDCVSLCQEAQAGSCTTIQGDCTAFCDALDGIRVESNCGTQQDAYESCLSGGPVCDQGCDVQEDALSTCAGAYCAMHTGDADCQVLISSF